MTEYPKMLYRKGTAINYKGVDLDSIQVADFEEEQEAKRHGYDNPEKAVHRINEKNKFFRPFTLAKKHAFKHWQFWLMAIIGLPSAIAAVIVIIERTQGQ